MHTVLLSRLAVFVSLFLVGDAPSGAGAAAEAVRLPPTQSASHALVETAFPKPKDGAIELRDSAPIPDGRQK